MIERDYIPENLRDVIKGLERFEEEFPIRKRREAKVKKFSGEDIIKELEKNGVLEKLEPESAFRISPNISREREKFGSGGRPINTIPIGYPGGCCEELLVAVGNKDDVEKRILEAIEHCAAKCSRITKYVLFYAFKWDSIIWESHKVSFSYNGIIVVKKGFRESPVLLTH